jgi:two-component system response regulator WspF
VKIGIVNDSPLAVEALRRAVALAPEHQIVWVAKNGAEAVALCRNVPPTLVLMDLVMPEMDGVEATRRIMSSTPCAILIVTVSIGTNSSRAFEAMGYGALDAVDAPMIGTGAPLESAGPLLMKIETIGRMLACKTGLRPDGANVSSPSRPASPERLIAIGASAGGPAAVATVLRGLPKDFPAAIVIIQHVDRQFAAGMADWLGQESQLAVRLAREGDRPAPGEVLMAGTSDHLVLKGSHQLGYTQEPRDYVYRPSVDVFFQSVSHHWQGEAVAVLLTGMGRDGALGLKALRNRGFHTIAQDEATSAVYGMPKAAARLDAASDILPGERIASRLVDVLACKR